jgi:hypothetical protein
MADYDEGFKRFVLHEMGERIKNQPPEHVTIRLEQLRGALAMALVETAAPPAAAKPEPPPPTDRPIRNEHVYPKLPIHELAYLIAKLTEVCSHKNKQERTTLEEVSELANNIMARFPK